MVEEKWSYCNNTDYKTPLLMSKTALLKLLKKYHHPHSTWGNLYAETILSPSGVRFVCKEGKRGGHHLVSEMVDI